jgi:hypothetical protein
VGDTSSAEEGSDSLEAKNMQGFGSRREQSCIERFLVLDGGLRTCEEPDPGVGAQLITQPTNETSAEEAQQRTQRLLVGDTEGQVAGSFP